MKYQIYAPNGTGNMGKMMISNDCGMANFLDGKKSMGEEIDLKMVEDCDPAK